MSPKPPTLATATDLVAWADRLDARSCLPRLVRRLLLASDANVRPVGFRADEGVDLGGWDGVTHAEHGDVLVPPGNAGWELTVRADTKRKADQGYRDRLRDTAALVPEDSTFVFVTVRRWRDKAKWAAERLAEGRWRDVRVLDADDLETWLEARRGVHQWFSRTIGKHPAGCDDLESFWQDWAGATSPTLPPHLILAGRERVADTIATWYTSDGPTFLMRAESPEEAVALLAAAVMSQPQPLRDACIARTVVVRTREAWDDLCCVSGGLVLVPRFDDPETLARARRVGHRTVTALRRGFDPPHASVRVTEIPRLSSQVARQRFCELGFDQEIAWRLATLARRSLPALRRKLAHDTVTTPSWVSSEATGSLVAFMLVGAWRDDTESDATILVRLADGNVDGNVDGVLRPALRLSQGTDPFLRRSGSSWYLASPEDSWSFLGPQLTEGDLRRFDTVVLDVLGELDPRLDLPQDRRWMALERRRYSGTLRRGLAESLAMLGSRGGDQSVGGSNLSLSVATTVSQLFAHANADSRHWPSLAPFLPLLAESAPEVFLDAVETGFNGSKPLMSLFGPENHPLVRSVDHAPLLWALETLAWDPDLLGRVAGVLSRLAELDPGGPIVNRPRKSLRDIFLIWLPGTNAPWKQRFSVLEAILDRYPEVGWQLCGDILPHAHSMTSSLRRPTWREWEHSEPVSPSPASQGAAVAELMSLMLQKADAKGGRWQTLVRALPTLPMEQFGRVVQALEQHDVGALGQEERNSVYGAIRATVAQHRRFPSAEWALPGKAVDRLALLESRYAPTDPIYRLAWLFAPRADLRDRGEADDGEGMGRGSAVKRQDALVATYRRHGRLGVEKLLELVANPSTLGIASGESGVPDKDMAPLLREWLAHSDPRRAEFARAFVGGRSARDGREWGERLFRDSSLLDPQRAEVLAAMPNDRRTWELAGSNRDISEAYWRQILPHGARETGDVEYVVRRLVKYGRSVSAVGLLAARLEQDPPLESGLILDVLEAALQQDSADVEAGIDYEVGKLLDHLVAIVGVDESRLIRLEFGFAALLRFERPPTSLHRLLAKDPSAFAWLVTLIYRRAGADTREATEAEANRAELAFQVLESWSSLPALSADRTVDALKLTEWVDGALAGTAAEGRGEVGAELVGEVLSTSPQGADGIWSHEAVRGEIERLRDERVEEGFRRAVYNSRGVVTKSPFEGGEQERKLARRYGVWASAAGDQWPRVRGVLREIATDYRRDAAREDGESERRGDGIL